LIFGGSDEDKKADLIQYTMGSGAFTRVLSESEERDFHTGCLQGGFLYIIGVSEL